jgi:proteasome lid subunit RPN8/RPN11
MLETILKSGDTEERCGLLLTDDTVVPIKNIANDPVMGFLMDPTEVLPYLTEGKIKGTWHTHPQGPADLSNDDLRGFLAWPNLVHYIIGPDGILCYRVDNGAVVKCD